MNKQQLHHLHQLLDNALYLSMDSDKMPDHMKGIQEALSIIKSMINSDLDSVTVSAQDMEEIFDNARCELDINSGGIESIVMRKMFGKGW